MTFFNVCEQLSSFSRGVDVMLIIDIYLLYIFSLVMSWKLGRFANIFSCLQINVLKGILSYLIL